MNAPHDPSRDRDIELWQRVLADEQAAFEEVVGKYQNLVASVAYSATGNFSLSEEITQETFWQAWRQRFQLRDHARLAPWLCGIARNMAIQASKREARLPRANVVVDLGSWANDPALNSVSSEERQLVWNSLEKIPKVYREALVLFYREDHSLAEVALALDVSVDVVKQRVHRGRQRLRMCLAKQIEDVLVRSRPGRSLTSRVMIGLAAWGASLKATSTAGAATVGTMTAAEVAQAAAVNSLGGIAAAAVKSAAVGGTATGVLGGIVGAAGGLGGAFLGCWLPSQLAETIDERRLLEKHGWRSSGVAVVYVVVLLALTRLALTPNGLVWYFSLIGLITVLFVVTIVSLAIRAQAQLKQLKSTLSADAKPNPSYLRRKVGLGGFVYRGKQFTSRWRLLGVPLVDIQHGDFTGCKSDRRQAFGLVAVGDRATGLLFAAGGVAQGLIAFGGLAIGGIAVGGCAVGGLALGGAALGWLACGGAAIGYDAVGGLAIAWHVATGGGAIAHFLAVGGGAWAQEYAVGGGAWANEVNTVAAQELANAKSKMWMLDWLVNNKFLFIVATLAMGLVYLALLRLAYRRQEIGARDEWHRQNVN